MSPKSGLKNAFDTLFQYFKIHGRKPMKKKYFNIILLYMICSIFLAGCGNKENDTTYSDLSNSENTSQTSSLNKESAFSKNVVSFEEMNYNAFLKIQQATMW